NVTVVASRDTGLVAQPVDRFLQPLGSAIPIADRAPVTEIAIAGEPDHFVIAWQDDAGELGAVVVDGSVAGPLQSLGPGREPKATAHGDTLELYWVVDATATHAELRSAAISRDGLGKIVHF